MGINVNDSEDYVVYTTETLAPALSGLTFFAGVPLETKLPRPNSNTHVTALGHPATACWFQHAVLQCRPHRQSLLSVAVALEAISLTLAQPARRVKHQIFN